MPERIVVSFRGAVPADPGGEARYLERALTVKKRAEALGAALCAWSAQTFSFVLSPEDIEEALSLAALTSGGSPPEERLGVALAQGEMRTVGEGGSFASLAWGRPLVTGVQLARLASAGEVLIDADLWNTRPDELTKLGASVVTDPIRGVHRLELRATPPFERGGRALVSRRPAAPPISTRPESSSFRRATLPAPAMASGFRSVPPPPSSNRASDFEIDPHELATQLADLAKQALVQGDIGALERLINQLKVTGEHGDLVERMSSFVALGRGATAEALRRLRAAAELEQAPEKRARARLAYGVALAAAGRTEGAVLEGLEALARARESSDVPGQNACVRFLARLSAAAGHPAAAAGWSSVASPSPTA